MNTQFFKHFFIIFFIFLFSLLNAKAVEISHSGKTSLLENTHIHISDNNISLNKVIAKDLFVPHSQPYINIGMQKKTIWIDFELENNSSQTITKSLILSSPLLEHIALYEKEHLDTPKFKGVTYLDKEHHTLFPYYTVTLKPNESKHYYLQVRSLLTPVDFMLYTETYKTFHREDQMQQFINTLLIGFVLALTLYSFILFFYTKDKSYLYYSFYLFALIYQQMTYLGLTQVYFPLSFVTIDMHIPGFKVDLLIITAALFAIHFLKIQKYTYLYATYKVFIAVSLLEILILSTTSFHNLYIVTLTGALFIIFNLSAGIIVYLRGYIQARLFIAGFGIVFVSYMLMILDALGLTSIIQDFQNILMFGTAFESLILSLAFADRYILLQKEKAKVDAQIHSESKNRMDLVKKEVVKKTEELHKALDMKELLLREMHHRVKNNLQIILSMIRLQKDEIADDKVSEKFTHLENRINAISQTYNMLLVKDDLEEIDMQEYIDTLLADLDESFNHQQQIKIQTNIDAIIPLREAVYIGLIVNELVTNAYKYAFDGTGSIYLSLYHQENRYTLKVEDDGKGYDIDQSKETLGLQLVHTLVYDQLRGEMQSETKGHCKYIIRFTL